MANEYNTGSEDTILNDDIPDDAWDTSKKIDIATGTNRYLQMQMQETLRTLDKEINTARESDNPFNTLVVLLARNDKNTEDADMDYDYGLERYFTQVGNQDYAIDLAVQFAIESSKEYLKELVDNNPKMTPGQYRELEKGVGFNIIKRVIDDFDLKDDTIDLNELKGNLSDVIQVTDSDGNPLNI